MKKFEGWMRLGFRGIWIIYCTDHDELICREKLCSETPVAYMLNNELMPPPFFSQVVLPAGEHPLLLNRRNRRSKA